MKRAILSLALFAACASMRAAPDTQQEIDKLKAECDRAVSAVTRPIYQKYEAVLQQMLRRAQQGNDPEAVEILTKELELATLQAQTKESIQSLLAGSRWSWFDTSRPLGKTENWAEFYKDGTGMTSWGSSFKYDVTPPASLRIRQSTPPATWFFLVNASKKEAIADVAATGGGEQRSLKFLRTASPVPPRKP